MPKLLASTAFATLLAAVALAADPFPTPRDTEKTPGEPMPARDAAAQFRVPPGFRVGVFASEPDVRNPIAHAWDGRGQLWVAENYTYAERGVKFDLSFRDRVLVFRDAAGTGTPDSRRVFIDTVQRLTSVEVGRGGVWLMCPPQLLFVPDRDNDGVPDGPPEVVLDGFDIPAESYHNLANGLRWGPDGWLYGRCGASAPGKVRRPDQSPAAAVPLTGGVWRYHPATHAFEPLCHGTTNPWGHDWDAHGEAFFINTVNGHLWHLIPGAHYHRSHTLSPNPLVYEPMQMHADHWHWDTGKDWTDSRTAAGEHDARGGGHAHSGAMIYQESQWPAEYRGRLFTLNFHGRRANVEALARRGSGYVASHTPDTLQSADPFFRGIDLGAGPDGSVVVLDWSDIGECHEQTGVHRNSGRVFRVTHGDAKPQAAPDLTAMDDMKVFLTHAHPDEWWAREGRRELARRQATGRDLAGLREPARRGVTSPAATRVRLNALFTLQTLGFADDATLRELLTDPDEHLRTWAIRLLTDRWPLDTPTGQVRADGTHPPADLLEQFAAMAKQDRSGLVRLALASTLQRLPVAQRAPLAAALMTRGEDAADHNLPSLVWYGLIPVAQTMPDTLAPVAAEGLFPQVRQWAARAFGETITQRPGTLDRFLAQVGAMPEPFRRDAVVGLTAGLAGVRKATPPPAWAAFNKAFTGPDAARFQSLAQAIDVVFGDGRALDDVRRVALDGKADLTARKAALAALIEARPPDLRAVCERLIKERFVNAVAVRGLAAFDDPAAGKLIAENYKAFHQTERGLVVDALASRPAFAAVLLDRIGRGLIPRAELSAYQARQIRGFNDAALTKRLAEVWGEFRDSPKDKADFMAKLKADLTPAVLAKGDQSHGRALFAQHCATCHRLYGAGEQIGPDLTGAGRKDIDYLLGNIVDPSAVVTKDYQMTRLTLNDGRTLDGIVAGETERVLTLQTAKERRAIPKDEIDSRELSTQSLMPDGLLQPLTADQVRDLFAYLMGDRQAALPTP